MAKYKFYVSTKLAGAAKEELYEIDDSELEGMDEDKKRDHIWHEHYMPWVQDAADMDFWEEE